MPLARATMRDVRAIVTERGVGCDGTLRRQVFFTRRNVCNVRRSRVVLAPRPWRLSVPPVRERQRWQERPFTGESTKEAVKPLRGESRDVSAVPVKPVCVLSLPLHTVLRVPPAPGFPCALCSRGSNEIARLRRKSRRENESACAAANSTVVPDKRAQRAPIRDP